jgi:hypothetical protein
MNESRNPLDSSGAGPRRIPPVPVLIAIAENCEGIGGSDG